MFIFGWIASLLDAVCGRNYDHRRNITEEDREKAERQDREKWTTTPQEKWDSITNRKDYDYRQQR